ncbi:MAG TPA: hypothetical protein VIJ41_07660 [Candidatus Nanopelagicales bacterium]
MPSEIAHAIMEFIGGARGLLEFVGEVAGTGVTTAAQIIAVDPATGNAIAVRDLGPMDADLPLVTATALWIQDEQGSRVLQYGLSSLNP